MYIHGTTSYFSRYILSVRGKGKHFFSIILNNKDSFLEVNRNWPSQEGTAHRRHYIANGHKITHFNELGRNITRYYIQI